VKSISFAAAAMAALLAVHARAVEICPAECAVGKECKLAIDLPYDAEQSVLVATRSLAVGAGVVIRDGPNADGPVANLGKGMTRIGAGASVGGVFSNAHIAIGTAGRVNGPLTTAVPFIKPTSVIVKGKVTTDRVIHGDRHELVTVTFGDEPPVLVIGAERQLEPGRYGRIRVGGHGALLLSSGTYSFTSLDVAPRATLELDESKGPVILFVRTAFHFAGLEREVGGEGHVLVAVFGCIGDTLSASFRGTVMAPGALLSLAPARPASFRGRFFGESIVVGAKSQVTGLGITVPYSRTGGSRTQVNLPTLAVRPMPKLPALPVTTGPGCFEYTPNGWKAIPCATDAFVQQHFPHPDAQLTLTSSATPSLVYSQLAVTFPVVGTENNAFLSSTAGIPGCVSSGTPVANQFSIQNNTNQWTVPTTLANAGDSAAVQFTMQSDGSTTGICIWSVDISTQNYANKCVVPQVANRAGGALQNNDFGNIISTVSPAGKLSLVAQLSWVPPGSSNIYAVTDVDDTYGLGSDWSQVSGGILGQGLCSQAQFTDTEVVTEQSASTWQGDTQATNPVGPPPELQPNASAFVGGTGTVETSNLTAIGSPTVTFPNADLAVTSLLSSTSGSCLGSSHAYVKDNDADFGATPSNLGGQVFWESPDIFLVPRGTPVDLTAVSTETLITPGGLYDVYIRVHNDFGCSPVDNVRTLVYLADPSALSVQWDSITGGGYVGNGGGTVGVTAPAGGAALIGPIPFTAPTTGIGNGHKCILAAIQGTGEPGPTNTFDAPDSNQVAQRNLQFASPCIFPLTNGAASAATVSLTLTVAPTTGPAPSLTGNPDVEVAFDDADSSWYSVWSTQTGAGTAFVVTHSGSTTHVRLGNYSVAMNAVPLAAGQTRNATGTTVLSMGYPTALTLQIGATMSGTANGVPFTVMNGGSCVTQPPPVIGMR
jgi:hypothetical protein